MSAVNFYKRMVSSYARANKFAPELVEVEMLELGELVASFAPFVGSGGYGENDLAEIKEAQSAGHVPMSRLKNLVGEKVHVQFVGNGLDMVYRMALSSINQTDDEGDLVLVDIAKKCGEIAAKVVKAVAPEMAEKFL